jgi:hypothetical protein
MRVWRVLNKKCATDKDDEGMESVEQEVRVQLRAERLELCLGLEGLCLPGASLFLLQTRGGSKGVRETRQERVKKNCHTRRQLVHAASASRRTRSGLESMNRPRDPSADSPE